MFGAIERTAFRVLWSRLGLWRALQVGLAVQRRVGRGEPFAHLPPPEDWKERGSREQAGPAVVLFEELCRVVHEAEALSVTAEVVEEGAVVFLTQTIGSLRRADLEPLDPEARRAFAEDRGSRFPNATLTWDEVAASRVRFTVHACRLVELVNAVGHPELAPLFCQGDARFFGTVEPDVELIRPHTLATGGHDCPFTIQFKERE